MTRHACLGLLLIGLMSAEARAHELRTAVLQLQETAEGEVQATLKAGLARDGSAVALVPQFDAGCRTTAPVRSVREGNEVLRDWTLHCAGGLAGRSLRLEGLDPMTPDAVVVARFVDGRTQTLTLDRHDPQVLLQGDAGDAAPPGVHAYLPIGIGHILLGPDHLLFVLGLLMGVFATGFSLRRLVWALTAFTLAHSLTLTLAALGLWGLPSGPVEILIALSIVLLAVERLQQPRRAQQGLPPGLSLRRPAAVAFVCGLVHGLGFAGALADIGLPPQARGWALLLFNLGVETGQLLFVAALLLGLHALRRRQPRLLDGRWADNLAVVLGGIAMYWTLQRLVAWGAGLWA